MDYVLGLGSNLGSRRANIEAGLELLASTPGCRVTRVSTLYDSAPVGPAQPRYLNGAARVHSELPPLALLDRVLAIETQLGRERQARQERWGARTLDLDILWAPSAVHDARLSIPHPRLCERWFALGPLLEVAPELSAEYADALRALLPEAGLAAHVAAPVEVEIGEHPADAGGRVIAASAGDLPDALAAALTALGRELSSQSGCRKIEAQVLLGDCAPDAELEGLLQRVLGVLHAGFSVRRVALCDLARGRFDARLIVTTAPAPASTANISAAKVTVTQAREARVTRVEFVLPA